MNQNDKKEPKASATKRVNKINKVAFYGGADMTADNPVCQAAYEAAAYVASLNKVVVNGGGPGVMAASSKGAKSQNGQTLAVTLNPVDMPEFEGRASDNIADQEIKTPNYIERMFALMNNAELFVCFQGGTGTLSEWATAWLLAHLQYGNHRPLILYGHFWHEVMDVIHKHFLIGRKESDVYRIVENLEEFKAAFQHFEAELSKRQN